MNSIDPESNVLYQQLKCFNEKKELFILPEMWDYKRLLFRIYSQQMTPSEVDLAAAQISVIQRGNPQTQRFFLEFMISELDSKVLKNYFVNVFKNFDAKHRVYNDLEKICSALHRRWLIHQDLDESKVIDLFRKYIILSQFIPASTMGAVKRAYSIKSIHLGSIHCEWKTPLDFLQLCYHSFPSLSQKMRNVVEEAFNLLTLKGVQKELNLLFDESELLQILFGFIDESDLKTEQIVGVYPNVWYHRLKYFNEKKSLSSEEALEYRDFFRQINDVKNAGEYSSFKEDEEIEKEVDDGINLAALEVRIKPSNASIFNKLFLQRVVGKMHPKTLTNCLANGFKQDLYATSALDRIKEAFCVLYNSFFRSGGIDELKVIDCLKKYIIFLQVFPEETQKCLKEKFFQGESEGKTSLDFLQLCYHSFPSLSKEMRNVVEEAFNLPTLKETQQELNLLFNEFGLLKILFEFYFESEEKIKEIIGANT